MSALGDPSLRMDFRRGGVASETDLAGAGINGIGD
jgi:hypothetical protein